MRPRSFAVDVGGWLKLVPRILRYAMNIMVGHTDPCAIYNYIRYIVKYTFVYDRTGTVCNI